MDVGLTPAASSSCCCCYSGPGALLPPTPRSKGILNPGDPEAKRSRIGSDSGDPLAKSSETPGGLNPDGSSAKSLSTALEGMAWIKEVVVDERKKLVEEHELKMQLGGGGRV